MTNLVINCDGCCKGNPGPGGWGAYIVYGKHVKEIFGGEKNTTNNRMELTAAVKGLEALKHPTEVILLSDSKYLIRGMTEWISGWKNNKWNSTELKNFDLWVRLEELNRFHIVDWKWVKGHSGHIGNEHADMLANKGVLEIL